MIDTSIAYNLDYAYRQGSASPPRLNTISLTGSVGEFVKLGAVCYSFYFQGNSGPPIVNSVNFGVYESRPTFPLSGTYSGTAAGQSPGTATDLTYPQLTFGSGNYIDSSNVQDANPLPLTQAYNEVFGTHKTNAEIYAMLKRLYGEYEGFVYSVGGGSTACPFIGSNSYNFSFYRDVATTKVYFPRVANFSGSRYQEGWDNIFNGGDIYIDSEVLVNVNTADRLAAYLILSEPPLDEKLIFDVYVDGVIGGKGPNIQIKWRNNNPDTSELAESLITPRIWGAGCPSVQSGEPTNFLTNESGIIVPLEEKTPLKNSYSFEDDGYTTTYVGASDSWYGSWSSLERVLMFGLDKIPDMLCFLLRFDYNDITPSWGDLWYVYIPYEYEGAVYCEHAQVADSGNEPVFRTEVNVIGGTPPDEIPDDPDEPEDGVDDNGDPTPVGPYDPDAEKIDFSTSTPEGYTGDAVLTKTYCITSLIMNNVGSKIWSQSYFDVLKVQTNPIENIIACKWFPFTVSGTSEEIQIGNVPFGVYGLKIPSVKVIPFTSSFKYTTNSKRPGYLSCSPYTTIKLHLPYCGVVQLDATELLERTLNGKYVIDLITGDVLVILTLDGMPYLNIAGKMGVDIPLSATNRAQTELGIANKALSATLGAAAHTIGGDYLGAAGAAGNGILSIMGMDYTTQRSGTHSPACSTYEDRSVWVEIVRSIAYVSEGYRSGHGYPAHVYRKLAKGQGYVQIDKGARISVAMTDEENRELENIMQQGFYV